MKLHGLRRTEYVPFLLHEVTHFTFPDYDAVDDLDRQMYLTYHAVIRPESAGADAVVVAECPQLSYCRDWAPHPCYEVVKFLRSRIIHNGSQIAVTHYLCHDDQLRLSERVPVVGRWSNCT